MTRICAVLAVMVVWAFAPTRALPATPALSAAALYNQGNAFARAGRPGMAVLNYERAQLLSPGDADLAANLDAVRRAQHLTMAPKPAWVRLVLALSPTAAALLGMVGLTLLGVGVVVLPRLTAIRALSWAAAALGLVLMGITAAQAAWFHSALQAGVVVAPEVPARVTPVPMGETAFVLPEAATVTVAGEHDDYLLVKTDTGQNGWVPSTGVARVVGEARRP